MSELYWTDLLAIPIVVLGVAAARREIRSRAFDPATVRALGILLLGVVWLVVIVVRLFGGG